MRAALDLSHSTAWTVTADGELARPPGREWAELGWLGHFDGILSGLPSAAASLQVIDQPWIPGQLGGIDLLILPVAGRPGDRQFTASEAAALAEYQARGGAVLAFGDGESSPLAPDPALARAFGFAFRDSLLTMPRPGADHLMTCDIPARGLPGHPVTDGIDTVHVHRARPIVIDELSVTALLDCDGEVIAAAYTQRAGRVVFISNAEMFALPFLGRRDNLRFLLNAISWLGKGELSRSVRRAAEDKLAGQAFAARGRKAGGDLAQTSGRHKIDASPYTDVLRAMAAAELPAPHEDYEHFLAESRLRFHELPRCVRQEVGEFSDRSNNDGALLISGLPLDRDLPPTPADPHARVNKGSYVTELWLSSFGSALGSPFAYQQEQSGSLVQNVCPTPGNAHNISSESSAIELGFHTEMGFHIHQPDYLLLLCLRPDHDRSAKTIISSVRMIVPELTPHQRAVLSEPLFRPGIDYSFGSVNATRGNGPATPVLYGDPYDPFFNFDFDLMVGLSAEAEDCLRALRAAADRTKQWVRLAAGDLLIIDNRRAAHARSVFAARYDGQDRWLQRMCVVRDLLPSAADRRGGSRVIETRFAS